MTRNLEDLRKDTVVEDVLHVPGHLNPADLPTHEAASCNDLLESSEWISGPAFLYQPIEKMPFSQEFLQQNKEIVPVSELRSKNVTLLLTSFNP